MRHPRPSSLPGRVGAAAAALTALAAALGACTPMEWIHPQYGTSRVDADLTDCARVAHAESWRFAATTPAMTAPHVYRLPDGRVIYDQPATYAYDPYFNEAQLRDFCMRTKGYELQPVPEPKKP